MWKTHQAINEYQNVQDKCKTLQEQIHRFQKVVSERDQIIQSWQACTNYLDQIKQKANVITAIDIFREHSQQVIQAYASYRRTPFNQDLQKTNLFVEETIQMMRVIHGTLNDLTHGDLPLIDDPEYKQVVSIDCAGKAATSLLDCSGNIMNHALKISDYQNELLEISKAISAIYYKALFRWIQERKLETNCLQRMFIPTGLILEEYRTELLPTPKASVQLEHNLLRMHDSA